MIVGERVEMITQKMVFASGNEAEANGKALIEALTLCKLATFGLSSGKLM